MQEGQPTAWSTYVSVADADETAAKVKAAGGTVVVEPMDVMDIGRMAFFADPTGAVFGIWQPKTLHRRRPRQRAGLLVLERGAHPRRRRGQGVLLGGVRLEGRPPAFEGAPATYTVWEIEGKQIGGMMQMTDDYFPAEIPRTGASCFAVADCDATVAKARELGATITNEPMDMPIGRFAGMVDPQGAAFTVMQPAG